MTVELRCVTMSHCPKALWFAKMYSASKWRETVSQSLSKSRELTQGVLRRRQTSPWQQPVAVPHIYIPHIYIKDGVRDAVSELYGWAQAARS